jgi:hypothetical protein
MTERTRTIGAFSGSPGARWKAAAACHLMLVFLIGVFPPAALGDELPGAADLPVPADQERDPIPPLPEDSRLRAVDATHEVPGLKWWLIDTTVITIITWGGVYAINSEIRNGVLDSSCEQWKENISQPPEWHDGSSAVTNYVSHPMLGGLEFLAYRSRGHGFLASSAGVIFQSFVFEYAIEGPHKVPSAKDLLLTPLLGIPIGYGLDTLSVYLLRKEDKPLRYLGYVANPFNLLPTSKKYRWKVSVDPVGRSFAFSMRF